jgi:arsenate reductase
VSVQPNVHVTQLPARPVVLFACVHNSGRSVAAKLLTEQLAGNRIDVRSAGSEPGDAVNPTVAMVLAERGLRTDLESPTFLSADLVRGADVVITMGCGETCPIVAGCRYEEWAVDDPAGQEPDVVRLIVDDIEQRVRGLLAELAISV